jgi:hypothetical protein
MLTQLIFSVFILPHAIKISQQKAIHNWITAKVTDTGTASVNITASIIYASTIPNQTWYMNEYLILNLSEYFRDPDGETLTFTSTTPTNISILIQSNNLVYFLPSQNWTGTNYIMFNAAKSDSNASSNNVTLTVIEREAEETIEYITISTGGGSSGGGGSTSILKKAAEEIVIEPENLIIWLESYREWIINGKVTLNKVSTGKAYHFYSFEPAPLEEFHIILIDNADKINQELTLTVYSVSEQYKLTLENSVIEIDLDEDNINDLRIKFNGFENDYASMTVEKITRFWWTEKITIIKEYLTMNLVISILIIILLALLIIYLIIRIKDKIINKDQ